jgi:hypothetical protein
MLKTAEIDFQGFSLGALKVVLALSRFPYLVNKL